MIWFCGLGFLSFRCFCWSCSRIIEIIAAPLALAVWLHPKRNEIRSEEDERQKCHGVHRMHTRVRLPVYRKAIIIWSNIQQQLLLVGEIDQLKHLARHAGKTSFAAKGYEAVRIQFLYFPPAANCAHVQQVTTDTQRATKGKIKGRKCCRLRTKVTATHRPLVHNILYPDMVMRDSDSWGIPTKTVTIEVFFLIFFAMSFAFMAAI